MSRKAYSVMAGWLAAASVGLAQSGQPAAAPGGKVRPLSSYHATASTVDWSAEASEAPPEMPSMPVPRAATPPPYPMPASRPPAMPVVQQPAIPVLQQPAAPAQPLPAPMPGTPTYPPPASAPLVGSPAAPAAPVVSSPMPGATCGPNGCATAPTCNCGPCGPNGPCGPAGRAWVSAELLLWWLRGQHLPPLVTTSPVGTPRALAGVLGAPGTVVLVGNENVNDDLRAGMRLRSGFWFDECQTCGLDGSFFFLGRNDDHRSFNCFDFPVLARPFFNAATATSPAAGLAAIPTPDSELVCLPGVITGSVTVDTSSRFWGTDTNLRKNLCCTCDYRIDGLAGYRYLRLTDSVVITENLSATSTTNPTIPVGTGFLVQDQFQSKNEFNGGQVGLAGEYRRDRWYVDARGLIAFGNTHSEVNIGGATQISIPGGATTVSPGGLLALPSNIGHYESNQFSVVPEASFALGYQFSDGIRAFVGYTFLYWSNVRRAGDQIDLVVNPTQIPPGTLVGAPRPTFLAKNTDFWAQGISFGVEVRY